MYFIDVQGTLISDSDKSPINGACELLKKLNQKQIPYVVITNNTKIKSDEFLQTLRDKGLAIKDGAYIDPFCVLNKTISPFIFSLLLKLHTIIHFFLTFTIFLHTY